MRAATFRKRSAGRIGVWTFYTMVTGWYDLWIVVTTIYFNTSSTQNTVACLQNRKDSTFRILYSPTVAGCNSDSDSIRSVVWLYELSTLLLNVGSCTSPGCFRRRPENLGHWLWELSLAHYDQLRALKCFAKRLFRTSAALCGQLYSKLGKYS